MMREGLEQIKLTYLLGTYIRIIPFHIFSCLSTDLIINQLTNQANLLLILFLFLFPFALYLFLLPFSLFLSLPFSFPFSPFPLFLVLFLFLFPFHFPFLPLPSSSFSLPLFNCPPIRENNKSEIRNRNKDNRSNTRYKI